MRGHSPKSNLRSFRYSDEIAAILEAQEGNSLNEKFESLVLFCFYKLESRKKDLQCIEEAIERERDRLHNLQKATEELRWMGRDLQSAKHYFGIVERRAKKIAETEV
ncbi:hypothetical protein [Oscillibacter sp.]|uniref:hypothetical protein n=1 Tax=Oscillibacter sp. TaxID=1945593 RepID=UPI0028A6A06C|nr:hypothetical protein [Oscillibacter sp.]